MTIDLRERLTRASRDAMAGIELDHPETLAALEPDVLDTLDLGPRRRARRVFTGAIAAAAAVVAVALVWNGLSTGQRVAPRPADRPTSVMAEFRAAVARSTSARSYVIDFGSSEGTTTVQSPDRTFFAPSDPETSQPNIIDRNESYTQDYTEGTWVHAHLGVADAAKTQQLAATLGPIATSDCVSGPASDGSLIVTVLPDGSCPLSVGPSAGWAPGTVQAVVQIRQGRLVKVQSTEVPADAQPGSAPEVRTITIGRYNSAPPITLPKAADVIEQYPTDGSDSGTSLDVTTTTGHS